MRYYKTLITIILYFICCASVILSSVLYFENKRLKEAVSREISQKHSLKKQVNNLITEKNRLKLLKRFSYIEKKTELIRGLNLIKPVSYKFINKNTLRQIILDKAESLYPSNKFSDMEYSLKTIGLIDHKVDLKKLMFNLYQEQVAAFYDYDKSTLYTINNPLLTNNIKDMFVSHEITHVIQDQHFNLSKMGIEETGNDDKSQALSALIEGDATYCMNQYYAKNINPAYIFDAVSNLILSFKAEEIDMAPLYIKETMLFPYIEGLNFVSLAYEKKKQRNINDIFLNPPQSTEQILHPEKYFDNIENPKYPDMPDITEFLNKHGLRQIQKNIMGELNFRILLKRNLTNEEADTASYGWEGDRYIVFENIRNNTDRGYILKSSWDTQKDAREFHTAFIKWALAHYKTTQQNRISPYLTQLKADQHKTIIINLNNNECIVILANNGIIEDIKNLILAD